MYIKSEPYWILYMFIRAGQGMLGRYFPHFRLVRTAFHALQRGRGREYVWEGGRVSALLRCFQNWAPLYVKEAMESVGLIRVHGVV